MCCRFRPFRLTVQTARFPSVSRICFATVRRWKPQRSRAEFEMDVPYICTSSGRLNDIVNLSTLNAIDYLEVVDSEAPTDSPRQQTLLVFCVRPVAALTGAN